MERRDQVTPEQFPHVAIPIFRKRIEWNGEHIHLLEKRKEDILRELHSISMQIASVKEDSAKMWSIINGETPPDSNSTPPEPPKNA